MDFKKLLLEINSQLPNEYSINKSEINNSIRDLPRMLHQIDFKICSPPGSRFVYGIDDISYGRKQPKSEIEDACDIFKSIFQNLFVLEAELKVELVHVYDDSYNDADGCPHYEYDFRYTVTWSIVM